LAIWNSDTSDEEDREKVRDTIERKVEISLEKEKGEMEKVEELEETNSLERERQKEVESVKSKLVRNFVKIERVWPDIISGIILIDENDELCLFKLKVIF
jgi:hypothetical protein